MTTNVRSDYPVMFWTLVGLVILAPLPLGSVYAWSWALIALVVGGLLLAWSVLVIIGAQHASVGLQSTWFLVLPFALAMIWIVVQSMAITPAGWHHPLWTTAAEALETDISGAVSLNPYQSVSHLIRLIAYAGIFWLALQYSRKTIRARQILMAIGYAGSLYAAYGLFAYAFDLKTLFIFENPAYEGNLTSTFVNRNSYATYVGLGLVCITALILVTVAERTNAVLSEMTRDLFTNVEKAHATHMAEPSLYNRTVLTRLATGLTRGDLLLFGMWVCMVVALIFTHSRAGFISVAVALIALVIVIAMTRTPHRGYAATAAIGCVVVFGILYALAGSQLESRLVSLTAASEERPRVYELTLSAIDDSPVLGTGFGTFEEVFRFYRTSDIQGYYTMAHSTYLENVLELGLPAAIALFMVFGGFLYVTFRGIRGRRRDSVYPCVGFAATVLVALHSTVDFSLQIPAVAATYALLMGAACGQSWSTQRARDKW